MPSTYTTSLRLELQAAGENLNTWGAPKLNNVINRADFAIAGMMSKALTGDYALTTSNTSDDEARAAILKFTGAGPFTVTIPAVSKVYQVWNACSAALTITTGGATTAVLASGEVATIICDGASVRKSVFQDFGGLRLTNLGNPVANQDATTKLYVDNLAFGAVDLPAQAGHAGEWITTDGTNASWSPMTVAKITDYAADQAARQTAMEDFALVMALIF